LIYFLMKGRKTSACSEAGKIVPSPLILSLEGEEGKERGILCMKSIGV